MRGSLVLIVGAEAVFFNSLCAIQGHFNLYASRCCRCFNKRSFGKDVQNAG